MADKIKDAEDVFLESLLGVETIADDGFSDRIVVKIRRRQWLRNLMLPVAATIGAAIAFEPAMALVAIAAKVVAVVPGEMLASATDLIPSLQLFVTGGLLLAVTLLGLRLLED